MIDTKVFEVRNIQYIVGLPAVRIDYAIGNHLALDDRNQHRFFTAESILIQTTAMGKCLARAITDHKKT